MMTLRQVEVIRAVMVTGTIGGAAKLLNVSAPGISRLVKYTERSLGILLERAREEKKPAEGLAWAKQAAADALDRARHHHLRDARHRANAQLG